MQKNAHTALTAEAVRARAKEFKPGDLVQVEEQDGKLTEAYIVRFFPHIVQYETENGRRFTTDYLSAAGARLLRPAGFKEHTESMDREAVLKALGERKLGDQDGEEM